MMINNSSSSTGAAKTEGGGGMKKGPWTAGEDAILTEYVRKHGEGNWNAVQRNSGLRRCGKSCRLRWANHLRPNLKKGAFSPEEENIIIQLHAKLGNKWARMAAQLPGRTDNEIKNYWNTRMKRRQRAGLPIYPQEINEAADAFEVQQEEQQQQQLLLLKRRHSSSSSLSSLLSASQSQKRTCINPSPYTFGFSTTANSLQNQPTSFYSDPYHQFTLFGDTNNNNIKNGSACLQPLSPVSPFRPSSNSSLYNHNLIAPPIPSPSFQFSPVSLDRNLCLNSMLMEANVGSTSYVPKLNTELPLSQSPPPSTTHVSSGSSSGVCVVGQSAPGDANNDCEIAPKLTRNSSGLLDALLQESQSLSCNEKSKGDKLSSMVDKGKRVVVDTSSYEEEGNGRVELSSSQSSIGMKQRDEEALEEMNSMDDDLVSLLTNFPSSMPLPEWYPTTGNTSNGSSSNVTGDSKGLNSKQNSSATTVSTPAAGSDIDRALSYGYWNNMPSIC